MEENNSILLKLIENKYFNEILEMFPGDAAFLSPSLELLWSSGIIKNINLNEIIKSIPVADLKSGNACTKSFSQSDVNGTLCFLPINYKNSFIGLITVFIKDSASDKEELNEYKHDFNNIITIILNLLSASENEVIPPESMLLAKVILEDIAKTGGHSPYTFKAQLQIVCSAFRRAYQNRITLKDEIKEDLWNAGLSTSSFFRIMTNLLTNSVEELGSGGTITIKAFNIQENLPQVVISVADDGKGIPESIAASIFNEGFSTKNRGSGSGLGIVKRLVEKAGGSVELKGVQPKGTEFILIFPASEKEIKHLAIVEDEALLNDVLSSQFEDEYFVHSYLDGESLLADEYLSKIDLVIIDKKLPGLNGIECIEKLRAKNNKAKIILASGSDISISKKGKQPVIDKIISKPYNFEELSSAVSELLS